MEGNGKGERKVLRKYQKRREYTKCEKWEIFDGGVEGGGGERGEDKEEEEK